MQLLSLSISLVYWNYKHNLHSFIRRIIKPILKNIFFWFTQSISSKIFLHFPTLVRKSCDWSALCTPITTVPSRVRIRLPLTVGPINKCVNLLRPTWSRSPDPIAIAIPIPAAPHRVRIEAGKKANTRLSCRQQTIWISAGKCRRAAPLCNNRHSAGHRHNQNREPWGTRNEERVTGTRSVLRFRLQVARNFRTLLKGGCSY